VLRLALERLLRSQPHHRRDDASDRRDPGRPHRLRIHQPRPHRAGEQHGSVRVALSGSDGAARASRRGARAPADSGASSVRPQHLPVRSGRPQAARRDRRRAHAEHRRSLRRGDGRCRPGRRSDTMTTPSDITLRDSPDSSPVAPQAVSEARRLYWSIRREVWENRSIYLAPLIVAAFVLFASLIVATSLPKRMRNVPSHAPAKHQMMAVGPSTMAAIPIMFVTFVVGAFYSFDALYGERRDRSILFWKSLPVSDRTTVLSKAAIPLIILPALTFAIILLTHLI